MKGIACLAFSPSGDKLVGAAIDDNHLIAVYDVKVAKGSLLASTNGGREVIVTLKFKNETVIFYIEIIIFFHFSGK